MALSFLYPLCVWFCVICTSMETGFIYQYPAVGLQRVTAQQRSVSGPPGATQNQYRNWCQYTVSRTVSCQVHNGTETTVQRVFRGCRWPGPCPKLISYRTLVRPAYKVAYRQVTAREWRCCPGFIGETCREGSARSQAHAHTRPDDDAPLTYPGPDLSLDQTSAWTRPTLDQTSAWTRPQPGPDLQGPDLQGPDLQGPRLRWDAPPPGCLVSTSQRRSAPLSLIRG
ncbi:collagen alpha-1(XXVI) chain-like [Gadus morhua]|uniref:collagen alpha-1(XXVI) chain-like n=1 Tax=Gadus morhua TaxID=8049 RepID=UPI0011B37A93|nr:collagen alpha-1(XXVI) chain-like [Gadus morhua]